MSERKIILESRVGSHLYGTNRPESDEDFQGIFIPSKQDLLGLQNCPNEWSMNVKLSDTVQNQKGDVDRKFYSLKRFFNLAAEGQPGQLELLFANPENVISFDPIWSKILDNTHLFLSRKSIVPFIGFALSQAHKATMKGENLRMIQALIEHYGKSPIDSQIKLSDTFTFEESDDKNHTLVSLIPGSNFTLKLNTNLQGFTTLEIGGRSYDKNLKLKTFIANLKELEARYGKRTRNAADSKYDYKSLMHAYRLLYEADELLRTGKVTFPLAPAKISFLTTVREGTCGDIDHWSALHGHIDHLRQVLEPQSFLPEEPDYKAINELCIELLSEFLNEKK